MKTTRIRHFRRVLRRFTRLIDAQLKSCCDAVTFAQCLVLLEVEELEGPTVGEIASNLRLDTSTLSRTLDGLEARGLVERVRGDHDRRVVTIRLTASGEAECRSINEDNDGLWRAVLERIPASRRDAVIGNFEVLVQAFLDCEEEASCAARRSARDPDGDQEK